MKFFPRKPAIVEIPSAISSSVRGGILICTSPRSGSNHLAELMASVGLGYPVEWFGGRRLLAQPDYPREAREQLLRALTDGRSPSGIYAIKLFASQFAGVARELNLHASLPNLHYVRLTRDDLLGQAISWVRARQTDKFRSTERSHARPRYDRRAIAEALEKILLENLAWDGWFAKNGLPYLSVAYEQILEDPLACLRKIAELVGERPASESNVSSTLGIQRDELNEQWRARFLSEQSDPSIFRHRRPRFGTFLGN